MHSNSSHAVVASKFAEDKPSPGKGLKISAVSKDRLDPCAGTVHPIVEKKSAVSKCDDVGSDSSFQRHDTETQMSSIPANEKGKYSKLLLRRNMKSCVIKMLQYYYDPVQNHDFIHMK